MENQNIIVGLGQSRQFLADPMNSKQISGEKLEELYALLSQALEQAVKDDREGLLESLDEIDKLAPAQFSLTYAVRENL